MMIFPYLTLQALGIGLSYEDISIIYGIVPALSFMASPTAGFIGDRIGYKPVVVLSMVLCAISSTSFTFIPVYREYHKIPYVTLVRSEGAAEEATYTIQKAAWPLCDPDVTTVNLSKNWLALFPTLISCLYFTQRAVKNSPPFPAPSTTYLTFWSATPAQPSTTIPTP